MTEIKAKEKVREPLFHITKRRDPILWWQAWLIRIGAILAALIVSSVVIMVMTKLNPMEIYKSMFEGCFGPIEKLSQRRIWAFLQATAMLLAMAIAVTPAFKMKFWNLGAEGQVLVGGLASAACMFYIKDSMPNWLLILIMVVTSVLAGIIWAVVPAVFKAVWNTNETLFTLMMNYVAIQLVTFTIATWVPTGSGVLPILNMDSQSGWLPVIGGSKYFLNIVIVALLTVLMFVYLKFSKHGYEISVVGESQNTARYVGINVKKVIIRTVILSGGICGLTGFMLVSGDGHTVSSGLAGGNGFTAILVSWLAKFNPAIMVLSSLLIVFFQKGSGEIAVSHRLDNSISDIITGIILFFIIGCEFFINYKINLRQKEVR